MAKFVSPLDGVLRLTQTYHTGGNNTAIDLGGTTDTPVKAIADGTIAYSSPKAGSYCTQQVDGSNLVVYYVHTYKWLPVGTRVKKGQVICYIAPKSLNGGYPTHLHLGLTAGNYIMDYFDRSIQFTTNYQDIANEWFVSKDKNAGVNWGLFRDLHISIVPTFKIGDKVVFTGVNNVRSSSVVDPTDKNVISKTVAGQVAFIKDGVRYSNGYPMYDMDFVGGGTGWVAYTGRFRLYDSAKDDPKPTPTPVTPPTPKPEQPPQEAVVCLECKEWEKRYEGAREKNEGLKIELRALEEKYSEVRNELKGEKEKVKMSEIEKQELNDRLGTITIERNRFENEKLKLQEKYTQEYKTYTRWSWLISILNKLIPERNARKA